MIIGHKDELEEQLALLFEKHNPEIIGNEYLVMAPGPRRLDRGRRVPLTIPEMVSELYVFQEVLLIEPADQQAPRAKSDGRTPPSPWIARGKPVHGNRAGNGSCWCGSGRKYKNCHLLQDPG